MGHTITIRIQEDLAKWLKETTDQMGVSQGQFIREQIEKARHRSEGAPPFMRLAGSVRLERDLSSRKGFHKPR